MTEDETKSESNRNTETNVSPPGDAATGPATGASGKTTGDRATWSTALSVLGFVAALGVGFYAGKWLTSERGANAEIETGERYRVELRGDEPQKGPDDALVTVVEFADFECPFCARGSETLMKAVESFDDDVRVLFKHYPLPFHAQAIPAARAAWAAHQYGKFWEFHHYLYEHKADISEVNDYAASFGIDADEYSAKLLSKAANDAIDDDRKAGAQLKISGTPAYLVNGHLYSGALTERGWKQILEAELEVAEDLVDGGTPRARVYEALMAGARTSRVAPDEAAQAKKQANAAPPRLPGEAAVDVTYKVPLDDRPSVGPENALVTIVVFSDFQCPFCARLGPILRDAVERHDDVRLVFRNMPLPNHPNAVPAAKAALAAHRQGKFWEMHDRLFAPDASLANEGLRAMATELALDLNRFETDQSDATLGAMLDEDQQLAQRLGVVSTPTCFINGRYVRGAQTAESLDVAIEDARTRAQAALDQGADRGGVYAALMEGAASAVSEDPVPSGAKPSGEDGPAAASGTSERSETARGRPLK